MVIVLGAKSAAMVNAKELLGQRNAKLQKKNLEAEAKLKLQFNLYE